MLRFFISDLHLSAERPDITQAFYQFLSELPRELNALYILGDFFDAWIGDDDDSPFAAEVASKLKQVSDTGLRIYFIQGNRDFLLGEAYAAKAGMSLLNSISTIEIGDKTAVLLHGDELCIDDTAYMAMRQQFRNPLWQAQALQQPLATRRVIAAQLREKSAAMSSMKAQDIMDVNRSEVERVMAEHHATIMIHGHTHRPARHSISVSNAPAERIVLGDWHDSAWCLRISDETITLDEWPISHA